MKRWSPLALWAALGCMTPTLRAPQPNDPARDEIVVVGAISAVPAFAQHGPMPTNVVFAGSSKGNLLAYFAADEAEPWNDAPNAQPLRNADTALVPLAQHFFFVAPRAGKLILRGVLVPTDMGAEKYELSLPVEVRPGDRVVYVGEIKLVRTGQPRVLVRDDRAAARKDAADAGLSRLLQLPWTTRLARP